MRDLSVRHSRSCVRAVFTCTPPTRTSPSRGAAARPTESTPARRTRPGWRGKEEGVSWRGVKARQQNDMVDKTLRDGPRKMY